MLRTVGKVALEVEVGTNVGERVIDSSLLSAAVVVGGGGGGSCRVVGMVGGLEHTVCVKIKFPL